MVFRKAYRRNGRVMDHLIKKVYEFDEHRSSDKPNSISVTTLIGPAFKAKKALDKAPRNKNLIKLDLKRSSTLGTAFHKWAEHVLEDDTRIVQEIYVEKTIELDGVVYTISGSCDLLEEQADGTWTIGDWKTGYGKERQPANLEKDRLQLSMYRWLLSDKYNINDIGYTMFISMSHNAQAAYPNELIELDKMQEFVEDKLFYIVNNEANDCHAGVKYNTCNYCDIVCSERKA